MPIYVFECHTCPHRVEVLQKHDDPPPICNTCDERLPDETPFMAKCVTAAAFKLKGAGWAHDNYGLKT